MRESIECSWLALAGSELHEAHHWQKVTCAPVGVAGNPARQVKMEGVFALGTEGAVAMVGIG